MRQLNLLRTVPFCIIHSLDVGSCRSQWSENKRCVTWALFGWLKSRYTAMFWVICRLSEKKKNGKKKVTNINFLGVNEVQSQTFLKVTAPVTIYFSFFFWECRDLIGQSKGYIQGVLKVLDTLVSAPVNSGENFEKCYKSGCSKQRRGRGENNNGFWFNIILLWVKSIKAPYNARCSLPLHATK